MSSEENEKSIIALLKEISNSLESDSKAATEATAKADAKAEKKAAEITKSYEEELKALEKLTLEHGKTEAYERRMLDLRVKVEGLSKEAYERQLLQNAALADEIKNIDTMAGQYDDLFSTIGGFGDAWKKTAAGKLFQKDGLSALQQSMAKTFTLSNMLGSSLMKVQEASFELTRQTDDALVEFNKATGATRLYGDQIIALEKDMYRYGVSVDDAAQTYGSLVKEVTGFNQLSGQQQVSMSKTVGMLNELGVDASLTADNIQTMTRVMGISATGAADFSREMFTLAQSIGMPPEEMAQAFQSASPQMAKFGAEGTEVFKKLAVNARAAGMEVDQMLSIVEKFDTFEGAAESVGKLNAILGGPFLSSLEMVQATDPTERMKLLSDAATSAGKSFDDMGYYERIALTEAMGLKDVSELALVMAGEFDNMAGSTMKSQSELADLAKQQQEFNTLADEAAQVARMFAMQLKPLVDIAKSLMQGIQDVNHVLGGKLVPILIGGITLVKGFTLATKGLTLATRAWGAVTTVVTGIQKMLAAATVVSNVAVGTSAPVMLAAGAAGTGASPGLGMFALAALAVGAAGLMIGVGIGAAAAGMSLFMTALAAIPPATLILYGPAFMSLAMGISMMATAFYALAPVSPLIAVLAAGLTLLGFALSSMDFSNLQPVADLFASMADAMNAPLTNLIKIQETIGNISEAITSIDNLDKAIVVKQLIEAASGQAVTGTGPTMTTSAVGGPSSTATTSTGATPSASTPIIFQVDLAGQRLLTKVVGHVVGGMVNPFKP